MKALFDALMRRFGKPTAPPVQAAPPARETGAPRHRLTLAQALASGRMLAVVGDSLSTADRHPPGKGWVELLARRSGYKLLNVSQGGSTLSAGLVRLHQLLQHHQPAAVLMPLGGNDGLRQALPVAIEADLVKLAQACIQAGALPIFVQPITPPNGRPGYAEAFALAYQRAAEQTGALLVTGWMESLGLNPNFYEADQRHPNTRAQPRLADHLHAALRQLAAVKS